MKRSLPYLLVCGASAFFVCAAHAADFTWTTNSNSTWTTAAAWTLNSGTDADGIPDADDNIINFTGTGIIRPSTTNPNNVNNFTFDNSVSNGTITPSTTTATATINIGGNLIKSGTGVFTMSGVGSTNRLLTVNVAGAMTVNDGEMRLSESNLTVTGLTTLNGGTLKITPADNSGVLGTSGVSTLAAFNGGVAFNSATTTTFEFNAATSARTTKVASLAGGGASTTVRGGTSSDTVVSTLEINGSSGSTTFAGIITNGHVNRQTLVTKTAASTQAFTAANTYSGGTTISAGTLLANNSTGSAFGSGAVSVTGGTVGGNGFIGGATTITGGKLAAGTDGTVGVLTFDSTLDLSGLSGSSQLKFDLGAVGLSDKIVLSNGALSIGNGAINFDDFGFTGLSGFGAGTYTLIDTSTSIIGTLGSSLSGTINGFDALISSNGQDLILTVTSTVPEPSSYAILAGLASMGAIGIRRLRRSS
jgi:autotransporter-associated beta strand protein